MNYYGLVKLGRKYALVYVTKRPGENSETRATGEYFRTWDEAVRTMNERNAALGIGVKR